jgi:hypothetical protein
MENNGGQKSWNFLKFIRLNVGVEDHWLEDDSGLSGTTSVVGTNMNKTDHRYIEFIWITSTTNTLLIRLVKILVITHANLKISQW